MNWFANDLNKKQFVTKYLCSRRLIYIDDIEHSTFWIWGKASKITVKPERNGQMANIKRSCVEEVNAMESPAFGRC